MRNLDHTMRAHMPTTANPPLERLTPQEELIRDFRLDMLRSAGYSTRSAEIVAPRFDIDWHTAAKMKKAGCEEGLALYILGATESRDTPSLN